MADATGGVACVRKTCKVRCALLAVSLAGLLVACWVGYHLNWIRERHHARVGFAVGHQRFVLPDGTEKIVIDTPDAPWPLGWFGEEGRKFLMLPDSAPQEEVDHILALFPEADRKIDFVPHDEVDPAFWR